MGLDTEPALRTILAKSGSNGGTPLIDHIHHVVDAIYTMAVNNGFDPAIAVNGAVLHDIGKCHPLFQKKLTRSDVNYFETRREQTLRHEISSIMFLPLFPESQWVPLVDMVIAHHKSIQAANESENGKGILDLLDKDGDDGVFRYHTADWERWSPLAINILSQFSIEPKMVSLEEARKAFDYVVAHCEETELGWSEWRGLLMSADHFASAFVYSAKSLSVGLYRKPDISFYEDEKRKSPAFPLSEISTSSSKPHTLVTAPTGAGKTDFLLKRCRNRIFYTLPFQASINAMYKRFAATCPQSDVRVQHSAGTLLFDRGAKDYEEKIMQTHPGASIKVLTPHQLAAIALGTKGYETIALDIRGNDVILDEIHSYSADMMGLIYKIIEMLLILDCNIHVGTATMPSVLRNSIFNLLGGEAKIFTAALNSSQLKTYNRHKIYKCSSFETAIPEIENRLKKNEKILIIANQVKRAQKYYEILKEKFPAVPQMLLHSRYKRLDRFNLENRIMNEFDTAPGPCIAVATQVVEVSLDISFDYMITEAAPIDSLIQRFGRINRRREKQMRGLIQDICILEPPAGAKETLPYRLTDVQKTFDLLPHSDILEEILLQDMIDTVYPEFLVEPIEVHSIVKDGKLRIGKLRNKSKSVLIESFNIDSLTAIIASDVEQYVTGNHETRLLLEIPLPYSVRFYPSFAALQRLECGSWPYVIPDNYYSAEPGFQIMQNDNFI